MIHRATLAVLRAVAAAALVGRLRDAASTEGRARGAGQRHRRPAISGSSAPLDLREFEVVGSEGGYRGVFLKLSRLPTAVTHSSANQPARIMLDIQGPTGTESAEEVIPGRRLAGHPHARVAPDRRACTSCSISRATTCPSTRVFPMADWVMVRIKPEPPRAPLGAPRQLKARRRGD